ncbi:hypothetical protein FACS1894152_7880 [Bacilli bacterium]|nr:hypothetical protein FACS1894152_7880 [Bacilli bacterium]
MERLRNGIKKYRVYIVVVLVLAVGAVHKKKTDRERLMAKESAREVGDANTKPAMTIMINSNLYNKTPKEKRKYLLNNFDMDCVVGDKNAKITMIDYSSFRCGFCKKMREDIKKIVKEYAIDKKAIRYVLRPMYGKKNIPVGAFLQCSRSEERFDIANELFAHDIDAVEDFEALFVELGKKYNMNDEYIKECIRDGDIYQKIIYMQQNNREVFNLNATPILIINGQEMVGYKTYEQIKEIIENLLKGARQ